MNRALKIVAGLGKQPNHTASLGELKAPNRFRFASGLQIL
jgi:hypothetical protein